MEEYVIDDTRDSSDECPTALINSICTGNGGIIRVEPGAYPPKVLWALRGVLRSLGVGYQWATIERLVNKGLHPEHAEHYVNTMINNLINTELPLMPSEAELDAVIKKYKEGQDGED